MHITRRAEPGSPVRAEIVVSLLVGRSSPFNIRPWCRCGSSACFSSTTSRSVIGSRRLVKTFPGSPSHLPLDVLCGVALFDFPNLALGIQLLHLFDKVSRRQASPRAKSYCTRNIPGLLL